MDSLDLPLFAYASREPDLKPDADPDLGDARIFEGRPHDKPLSFHWQASSFSDFTDLVRLPNGIPHRIRGTLTAILLDAALEARGEGRDLAYSRRQGWYSERRRYISSECTYRSVLESISLLDQSGFFAAHTIAAGKGPSGRQSSFQPSPSLAGLLLPNVTRAPGELVRLRDGEGHLVDYRDTARTDELRGFLSAQNEAISSIDLRLELDGAVTDGPVLKIDELSLYPALRTLYSVYNGDWNHGGRFYGAWWQQVPKRFRAQLTINGEATAEEDYSQLHPRLLYALAGEVLTGDAYIIPGVLRDLGKRAFNILLNAMGLHQAVGALARYTAGDQVEAARIIESMKIRHAPIARHFHTGIGLQLQNRDARMARRVVTGLRRQGIVALPIHDSFIVADRHRDKLQEIMVEAIAREGVVTKTPSVTNVSPQRVLHMGSSASSCARPPRGSRPLRLPVPPSPSPPAFVPDLFGFATPATDDIGTLVAALEAARIRAGLSQGEAAALAGITRSHWSNAVAGRDGMRRERIVKAYAALEAKCA